jgi:hypothetical protein
MVPSLSFCAGGHQEQRTGIDSVRRNIAVAAGSLEFREQPVAIVNRNSYPNDRPNRPGLS